MEGAIRMLATLSNPSGLKIGFITKVIIFCRYVTLPNTIILPKMMVTDSSKFSPQYNPVLKY